MQTARAADSTTAPDSAGSFAAVHSTSAASRALNSVILSLSGITFAILLLITYSTFTVPRYGYMGYRWDPDWLTIATGLIAVAALALLLPVALIRACDIFIHILFCFVFVPAQVIPSAFSPLTPAHVLTFQLTLSVCFLLILLANRLPVVRLDFKFLSTSGYELVLLALTAIMILPILMYMGVPTALPGFGDVYAVRLNARESMAAAPSIVGYIFGFLTSVMIPFLIAYGITRKRRMFVILGIFVTLYAYGLTGLKGLLFSLALLTLVYLGIRLFGRHLVTIIVPAAAFLIIGAKIGDLFIPDPWLTALMADRIFVTPGVLTGYYHEFFTTNGYGEWAYSFLGWASDYQYDRTPAFLIGNEYFNNPATQANTHFLADGVANFGFGGMLFVSIVASCIFWLTNSLTVGRSFVLVTSVATMTFMSLVSDSVFTSILTHGIGLALVLIMLMPLNVSDEEEELRSITIRL